MTSSFSNAAFRSRAPTSAAHAHLGATIAGKYRLVRALGHGGMGAVYKAENVVIGKVVAIKLLHGSLRDDDVAMTRFQREARSMVAIAHPNIVEVIDMGRDATGSPFLVMEYVRGTSLKGLLTSEGPLSVARAARVAGQVLAALAAAHKRGIIHRDLKPENILITARDGERDVVKVVDFGISTFADSVAEHERDADLTPTGLTMATPYYASPEQIRGANGRDPRVDIYAVGVLLFEMLTGHRPFDGESLPELCDRILEGAVVPLRAFRKDVPAPVEAIMRRALANRAQDRFQSALDLLQALAPYGAPLSRVDEPEPTDTFQALPPASGGRESATPAAGGPQLSIEVRADERVRPTDRVGPPPGLVATSPSPVVHELLARGLFGHFAERFGIAEVRVALEGLGRTTHRALSAKACQAAAFGQALSDLDRRFARGDRAEIVAAGRHFVRTSLAAGELAKSATPELFMSQSSRLWQRFFVIGEPRVSTLGRGYGRLEIRSLDVQQRPGIALAIAMLGMLEEGLKRSGASSVSVRLAESTALGDPLDAFEVTWAV